MALLFAFAMVAAACGGSGSDEATGTTSAETDGVVKEIEENDATGDDTRDDAGEAVRDGRLVYGIEADSANPWTHYATSCAISCRMILRSIADPLFATADDGTIQPYLVETMEPNADASEWTLNPRRAVRDIIAEPLFVWWEEEEGRPQTSVWFEAWGKFFQQVAGYIVKPTRIVAQLAGLAMVLWIVSEAVEERRFESQLGWLETPAQIIGFPVLAVILAAAAVFAVLGFIWLLLAFSVPFGVVSKVLGEVSGSVGLACAGLAAAVAVFMSYRTWNSLSGVPAWGVRGIVCIIAAATVVWFLASLIKQSRAGASGVAAALVAVFLLQLFYIAGLDEIPKLLVLLASAAVDFALFRMVRKQLARRKAELRARAEPLVRQMLETVGIDPDGALDRKPYEFSGGQAQRLSIARALIMDPKVIICDEPVSALDVSVQAQILNLLEDMKQRYGLTLVFIAHDLAVVKNVSDRVAVMYLGKICEVADPDTLYAHPAHPYSQLLLAAIPHPDPLVTTDVRADIGDLPSPINPPSGCRFRTRCPLAQEKCAAEEPQMRQVGPDQFVACHFPLVEAATDLREASNS